MNVLVDKTVSLKDYLGDYVRITKDYVTSCGKAYKKGDLGIINDSYRYLDGTIAIRFPIHGKSGNSYIPANILEVQQPGEILKHNREFKKEMERLHGCI